MLADADDDMPDMAMQEAGRATISFEAVQQVTRLVAKNHEESSSIFAACTKGGAS